MALIKCKGCGQMVSTKAEKCPKCGYSVRLSMEQQEETKQSVEPHTTTLNTSKEEVANDNPQPQQRGSKKGIIIAIVVVVIIGCGVLFALLNNNNGSNDQRQGTTAIADTGTIKQDELPSDSLAVATKNNDFVVSDSCATEALENITLYGSMTDANGTYPIELSFEKGGNTLTNCIYTNVDLGGKIRMDGTISDNDLIFIGKDGNNSFRICVNSHTLKGYAQDGDKRLQVSLSHNKNVSQNTLQQGPSWLQGTWIYHFDEDRNPSHTDCIYAEKIIKGNKLKVATRDYGSDFTYKYEGTWQYKDEGEGYFIYYFKDGGKGIDIDFDKKVLIVPDRKYVKDGDEWRRIYKYMKKISN